MATPVEQAADRKTAASATSVTKPTNLAPGDVCGLWVIEYDNASPETPAVTGFAIPANAGPTREATSDIATATYLHRDIDGSEGATFSVTGLTGIVDIVAMRITGTTTAKFQVANSAHANNNAPSMPAAVMPNGNNLMLGLHAGYNLKVTIGITGWTQDLSGFDGVNDTFHQTAASAGTVGPTSYSLISPGTDAWISLLVVYSDTAIAGAFVRPTIVVPSTAAIQAGNW